MWARLAFTAATNSSIKAVFDWYNNKSKKNPSIFVGTRSIVPLSYSTSYGSSVILSASELESKSYSEILPEDVSSQLNVLMNVNNISNLDPALLAISSPYSSSTSIPRIIISSNFPTMLTQLISAAIRNPKSGLPIWHILEYFLVIHPNSALEMLSLFFSPSTWKALHGFQRFICKFCGLIILSFLFLFFLDLHLLRFVENINQLLQWLSII
jgi:hypothetical protein